MYRPSPAVGDAVIHQAVGARLRRVREPGVDSPLRVFQRFYTLISGTEFDKISKLWLNARHLSRYRPALHDRVVSQELRWCHRIDQIIAQGVREGAFRCADPWSAAVRVLAVVDGAGAYINTSTDRRVEPLAIWSAHSRKRNWA
ncbi:TetR family transcriptional regulator C-terminal domain-containing protein [Streptomyces cuspidosporus]|uniref:BetI-type transcriptional repressor C-terminal domain-containing protein n=1 Tax=Streptomyces cuspidosporus TaxID=66882 RepID=A0ABN3FKF2_9ACTN